MEIARDNANTEQYIQSVADDLQKTIAPKSRIDIAAPLTQTFMQSFDEIWRDKTRLQDVTDEVIKSISAAYRENSPEYLFL